MSNAQKTLLITGATGGMGSACALLAASRGNNLILSDLNSDKLKSLADKCAEYGGTVSYQVLDVTDSTAIDSFISDLQTANKLDAIIHTLGLSPAMAEWDKIITVDLISTVELLEKLKSVLKPGGCAVCISSMSAHMVPANADIDAAFAPPLDAGVLDKVRALPDQPLAHSGMAYAYAKKALLNYVVSHAMAWGQEGKRLVSISPGLIDTDMGKLEAESDKDAYAFMRPLVALQRDGLPREIATAALFLASDDASYISGCDLLVDGGFVASFLDSQRKV